jgi:thiol-disulfide isomerase/thioredoxin
VSFVVLNSSQIVAFLLDKHGIYPSIQSSFQHSVFFYLLRYISTLTKSQKLVLKEGLLFARNSVLQYQQQTEKSNDMKDGSVMRLPYPPNYKSTLQKLFNAKIIYPVDRNENGSHQNKNIFVRGCSFPDYAEVEIWPNDSDSSIRFGFPVGMKDFTPKPNKSINPTKSSNEITSPTVSKNMKDDTIKLGSVVASQETNKSATERNQGNPFVLEVESLSHIRQEIVLEKKTAVLFVSAPYCRTCRTITPQFNRLARISKEENNSDLVFAKASTAGKQGKQITSILQIQSVPTFVLFREGERYGEPFGLSKLPSELFDTVIHRLENGEEWDPSVIKQDSDNQKQRTQL